MSGSTPTGLGLLRERLLPRAADLHARIVAPQSRRDTRACPAGRGVLAAKTSPLDRTPCATAQRSPSSSAQGCQLPCCDLAGMGHGPAAARLSPASVELLPEGV